MSKPITRTVPIYDALLALATDGERAAIIAGGPREMLDNNQLFGSPEDHLAAVGAYTAIKAIMGRLADSEDFNVTGIDPRGVPPRREQIDPTVVRLGHLIWLGPEGCESRLMVTFAEPLVHIGDVRVEPANKPSVESVTTMSRSSRLRDGERKDDTARLRLMQQFIDEGVTPTEAARKAARSEPDPHTQEESVVKRLQRKFKEREDR